MSPESAGDGTPAEWSPDGDDLARALIGRAQADRRLSRLGRAFRARRPRRSRYSGPWSGPKPDDRDPQAVGAVVDKLVGDHGWSEEIAVHAAIARWDQIVGPELAEHVRPEHFDDGVLVVRAASTAWATQVRLLAAELVRRLNREIGDGSVTRVQVRGPQGPSWRRGPLRVRGAGPRDTYG